MGVDLSTGQFHLLSDEVAIGQPGGGGLSFGRYWIGSGWRDNLAATITSSGSIYIVSVGAVSETFSLSGGLFTSQQQMGSTLTFSSGTNKYSYTTRDGTVFVFNKYLATVGAVTNFWVSNEGTIESITRPNGEYLGFTYNYATVGGLTAWRPQSIYANTGYIIHFTYANNSPANTTELSGAYLNRTKVTGINSTVYNCGVASFTCNDSTGANWPYVTYGTEAGGIQTVTDRLSQTTRYVISSNQLTQVRLPTSAVTARKTITYDSGKVSSVSSTIGGWLSSGYTFADASGTRTTTVIPYSEGGQTIAKTNLSTGWIDELWADSAGTRKTVITRDGAGRATRTTRADGDYTNITYDGRGNITQVVEAPVTGTVITTSASYPGSCSNAKTCNQPDYTNDARGFRTNYTYDGTHGGVLTITLPSATGAAPAITGTRPETRFTYGNAGGAIYRVTDIRSCASGTSCLNAVNETVQAFTYDSQRRVATTTVRAGNTSVPSATSVKSTITYTPQGDVASIDGTPTGAAATAYMYYDDVRRLRASVTPDPDGVGGSLQPRVSRTTYDGDGRVVVSEAGHVSSPSSWASMTVLQRVDHTYDLAGYGILSKTALSSGSTTYAVQQYGVGAFFSRCSMTRMNPSEFASLPADGCAADTPGAYGPDRIRITGYNGYRQGVRVSDGALDAYGNPARAVERAAYDDSSGMLEYLTDAEGNETKYEYDGFFRLVKTTYPSKSTPGDQNAGDYEQLTYDTYGRLTAMRGRDGQSFSYTYDNLGRLLTIDAPGSQPDIAYTYDNFGRTLTVSKSGHTITYVYDALSRIVSETTVESSQTRTVSYQYDSDGRRSRLTWPDGFYVTYGYNSVGELITIRENGAASGAGVLATFTYDNLGRRTALTRGNGGVTGYAYDGASQLIDLALDPGGSANDVWTDLSYNPAGQIVSKTINNTGYNFSLPSPYTDAYADNGLNQYTSVAGVTPTYTDSRGNMTYDGTKTYAYDYSNRMTAAGAATLTYDPAGRLYQTTGSSTARYVYDGADMIAEYNTAGAVVRRYVHGPGTDEPLVWYEGSTTTDRRHLYADERGSIVTIEAATTTRNTYDEFGVPGSGNIGRFQFTGQIWLSDIGLYHYKARAYNPDLGRFMQTDPIGYGDGMNIYAYVKNDPVNSRDPSGLDDDCLSTNDTVFVCGGLGPRPGWVSIDCTSWNACELGLPPSYSGGVESAIDVLVNFDQVAPPANSCQAPGAAMTMHQQALKGPQNFRGNERGRLGWSNGHGGWIFGSVAIGSGHNVHPKGAFPRGTPFFDWHTHSGSALASGWDGDYGDWERLQEATGSFVGGFITFGSDLYGPPWTPVTVQEAGKAIVKFEGVRVTAEAC